MKYFNVGTRFSPAKTIDHSEIIGTEILISYGGGMGGASKRYYATDVEELNQNEIKITCIDDRELTLNKSFIVSQEDVKILKQILDITEHANYHKKTCKENKFVRFVKFYADEEYTVVKNSNSGDENKIQEKTIYDYNVVK